MKAPPQRPSPAPGQAEFAAALLEQMKVNQLATRRRYEFALATF